MPPNLNVSPLWRGENFGLYLHIPFCRHLCHYCDFPKTVNYSNETLDRYFLMLKNHLKAFLENSLWNNKLKKKKFASINFGGGTPGIFSFELEPLFFELTPFLQDNTEITLEVNPNDITEDRLNTWSSMGINRLSIGIQTFDTSGLKFLTRDHTPLKALKAIEKAKKYFNNLNLDLIYSWPMLDPKTWISDLKTATKTNAPHLSLYNLTYEKTTPLGRALFRKEFEAPSENEQEAFFLEACEYLEKCGYRHEEISNWSLSGYSCKHNWLYWEGHHFIGIGAGAHGYLPSAKHPFGIRYQYPRHHRKGKYLMQAPKLTCWEQLEEDLEDGGLFVETPEQRSPESWLAEYIGCGLRSEKGIQIDFAEQVSQKEFLPNSRVKTGISEKILRLTGDKKLILEKKHWFRETAWSLEVLLSFR